MAIKGFGQKCFDEVIELLDAENQTDWLTVGKSNSVKEESLVEEESPITPEPTAQELDAELNAAYEEGIGFAADFMEESLEIEESVSDSESKNSESPTIADVPADSENANEPTPRKENASLKVLVIGNGAVAMNSSLRIRSFETVYAEMMSEVCAQAGAASVPSVDFRKGWAALGATIRYVGWPIDVEVITVSKSFLHIPEVVMELRLLADLVVEA
jgi:hypothetical protein